MLTKLSFLLSKLKFNINPTKKNSLTIIEMPIKWTSKRTTLIQEYSKKHYGKDIIEIIPYAIIIHWTASNTFKSIYNYFYDEITINNNKQSLNFASHFVIDRDGTIYQLTPETALNRHAIGYNWCAIGIENVGGFNGVENLTDNQLKSNIQLITYLKSKYPSIKYVWGHYQQDQAKQSGLFIENDISYYHSKIDPGQAFMRKLKNSFTNEHLIFYEP